MVNEWPLFNPRQHIKKQRHYFAKKGPSCQSYDFSSSHVWMWELDHKKSWAPKNWCFWTVVLEKTLLRVPWTARKSNQSILKEISSEYSLEGLMLKLKLQYFGHLIQRADSLETHLELWRKKAIPGYLYSSKNSKIILICIWILKSDCRFFF